MRAFSLIELVVVIAIVSILTAVAFSQYTAYKKRAKGKDLILRARACAQQIVAECEVGGENSVTPYRERILLPLTV